MIRRLTLACVGLALCAAGATQLFAAAPETVAAGKAVDYMRSIQNDDGGFPAFGIMSDAGFTADAVFAIASTGIDPSSVQKNGKSPSNYLASQAASFSATAGGAAKLVLGVTTLNGNVTSFGGIDPLAVMEANYNTATGQYGNNVFAQANYMIAEENLGRPVPAAAVAFAEGAQKADGGWDFFGVDTNTTALVIRALIAAGVPASDQHIVAGLTYLKANQQADGGFPYAAPFGSDPSSTAYVVQAIAATGQSVDAGGVWDVGGGKTPLTALLSFQGASGALQYAGADNAIATYQGIPGLMLAAFPERPASEQAATLTAIASAATSTATASATATVTATTTATRTPSSTPGTGGGTVRTSTPRASATAATTSTAAAAASTSVRAVLGDASTPARVASVLGTTHLPAAGGGGLPAGVPAAWLFLLSGGLLFAGAMTLWRGAR